MMGQTVLIALRAVWNQKLRSILTMLGVIIGVGAVISLVSLGSGASKSISQNIQGLGSNLIVANVGLNPFTNGGSSTASTTPPTPLSAAEVETLVHTPGVRSGAPVLSGNATLANGTTSVSSSLDGTNQAYAAINNYHLSQGRFLSPLDVTASNDVIVLGSADATTLFGGANPVGNTVTVNGMPLEVVGVLQAKATSAGSNPNDFAVIPWTTYNQIFGASGVSTVDLSAASSSQVNQVVTHLNKQLLTWLGSSSDFTVTAQSQILSTLSSVNRVTTLLLGGVAGISLVVGGIGIMNIMLVSVTERTREIGTRKAVGASTRDILSQFLVESLVLSGLGGLLGVGAGVLFSHLLSGMLKTSVALNWPFTVMAFLFALAVGLIFGLWPATRAALMRPVDALRVE